MHRWGGLGLLLDRGYTGHEHLWSVGLVHMNARLYDAKLHRFLQPDNFVQDPSSTQSFNRYAYCMNNPLMYTDTNGEFWHIIIGAVVGGLINWGIHGFRFDAAGAGYFAVGAGSGALFATGNVFGGTALFSGGNSVVDQLSGKGSIDLGKLIGDTVTGIAISYATMGIMKGAGSIFRNVPRPPISAISTLEPAGLAGAQTATLAAETTIATQATSTTVGNTAASAVVNAEKELAKAGLKQFGDGVGRTKLPASFGIQNLDAVNVVGKAVHANSLKSTLPNWGYKLFSYDGTFLKNGITSKTNPLKSYTKDFMQDKRMELQPLFENRQKAWDWEYLQNTIKKGTLNKNMH